MFHVSRVCIIYLLAVTVSPLGTSFEEEFEHIDAARWTVENGKSVCIFGECAHIDKRNVKFGTQKDEHAGMAQIRFRNGCNGNHCCSNSLNKCTDYITGQISSTQRYGFGTYIWQGIAIKDFAGIQNIEFDEKSWISR